MSSCDCTLENTPTLIPVPPTSNTRDFENNQPLSTLGNNIKAYLRKTQEN